MSDSAFKQSAFPAYTKTQLICWLAGDDLPVATRSKMEAEVLRRDRVEAGDWSVMTQGERLRRATAA